MTAARVAHPPARVASSLLVLLAACAAAEPRGEAAPGDTPDGPQAVVRELYELVTFGPGTTPDWDRVRALFVDEAVVVLRTGRETMSVFTLEGFVGDFVAFIEQADVQSTGFSERILGMRSFVYGDIAQVSVLFDSHIPGSERPPTEGVDNFDLVRIDGAWHIVSITNERPTAERPIPVGVFD